MTTEYHPIGEIDLDTRRRVSFGKVGKKEHTRYLVEEAENGELHLIPLISVPITALPPWRTKEEFDTVMAEAIEQARRDEGVKMSFAEYADDDS